MKRGHSVRQARLKAGRLLAADLTRASWTAAQNLGQRSWVSWRDVVGIGVVGGVKDRIVM